MICLANSVFSLVGAKTATSGKSATVWEYPRRGKLSAAVPVSAMNSRRRMLAPKFRRPHPIGKKERLIADESHPGFAV
jgi:hypothetical protein